MRLLFIIPALILFTSCGKNYKGDIDNLYNLNKQQAEKNAAQDKKDVEQDIKLTQLENKIDANIQSLNSLSDILDDVVNQLQNSTTQTQINSLSNQIAAINILTTSIQSQVNSNIIQLASVNSAISAMGSTVVEVIDPCGDGSGFDEVILKMSNGSLVGYFEDAQGHRFLTILQEGSYRTTDTQSCYFNVTSAGKLVW